MNTPNIHPDWLKQLSPCFETAKMRELSNFLRSQKAAGKRIFPRPNHFFRALDICRPDQIKAIILGQDPYHGEGQAEGLSFSVAKDIPIPPSLVNIYKELESDLGIAPAPHGHLGKWAAQGVLLLKAVLSVEAHKAASHAGRGWEGFTDAVIETANEGAPKVFILWGAYAQKKASFVDVQKHLVIKSPHPSPLSAHRGFFGSRPFSQTNSFLEAQGQSPIDWHIE